MKAELIFTYLLYIFACYINNFKVCDMIIPFRDENKNKKIPFVTISLILINIVVFIISRLFQETFRNFIRCLEVSHMN
jgi:hypothetical protein